MVQKQVSRSNTYTKIPLHIVFSVSFRKPMLNPDFSDELYSFIGQIISNKDMIPLRVGGHLDHIHILLLYKPHLPLSPLVKIIKTSTTFWIKENIPGTENFKWARGYAAFAVSQDRIEQVIGYIDKQKVHHERMDYEKEYRDFLDHHEIDYDERFLIDPKLD